ncbi:MAG: hypothetical protein ACRDQ5_09405, partial [Sciscionella sp.]
DNGDDMGRHSLRNDPDDEDGKDRTVSRGRHALDEQDEVLAWAWPSRDPDGLGDEDTEAVTEVLPAVRWQKRGEEDTVPNLELQRGWAALGESWPEKTRPDVHDRRPRHGRDADPEP